MKSCLQGLLSTVLIVTSLRLAAIAGEVVRYELTVDSGSHAREYVPVRVNVAVPPSVQDINHVVIRYPDGRVIPAQLSHKSLLSEPIEVAPTEAHRQLCFILDKLDAGQTLKLVATISESDEAKSSQEFAWMDTAGKYSDLMFHDRSTIRYMYEPLDESTSERREETYKVYHHVFDPAGTMLVTKGPGGLFPHHRGLFFGFNRIEYAGSKKADTWHCTGKAFESHDGLVSQEVGPVLGRHVVKVGWHGQEGETFANEERELTVYRQPELDGKPTGTLVEFASVLRSAGGDIKLDGDPQHSGFQFRASQEVPDKARDKTYYVRVDGKGKPGDYRNWPQQTDQVNLPWKGMSFVVADQRLTVAYLDRPENPKESRFSERDYGRFGSYFEYLITEEKPLKLNYRIWLQPGEMTPEQIDSRGKDFTDPPTVTVQRL